MALFEGSDTTVTAGNASDDIAVMYTTADAFRVLRLKASIGRLWTPDDEAHGETEVAVITDAWWRRRFGADPAAIGQSA